MRLNIFKRVAIILIVILLYGNLFAQNDTVIKATVPKIEIFGYRGTLLIHHEEMSDLGHRPYYGTELRVGFQTTGSAYWQQLFKYPTYGFGFYSGYFNTQAIGNPYAVFGFMELPFIRKEKFRMSTSWSVGLSFNLNEYDSITNPTNIAIGSDLNVYVDFSLLARYKLSDRWELGAGAKFQHFSNGAIRLPNLGLNMVSGQLVLSYYPGRTIEKFYPNSNPKPYKRYEFTAMYAGGAKCKSQEQTDVLYYNSTLSLSYNRRMNYKRTLGLGMDVFYNGYLENEMDKDPEEVTTVEEMSYAAFVSSDMIADRFRLVTQVGTYLWRATDYSIPVYERVALRYYFVPHMFANVSIKAHGAKAQYIEWGLGATL